MNTIIGLKQLREQVAEISQRVEQGESFTVVKRSKPIFQVNPIAQDAVGTQDEVAEWTKDFISKYRPAFEALANK